jgi:hypothetical protein
MGIDKTLSYVYAVTNQGMLRSDNGGATWVWKTAGMYDKIGFSVAVDTVNPDVTYTGTWASIYRSSNGSELWEERTRGIRKVRTADAIVFGDRIITVADQSAGRK